MGKKVLKSAALRNVRRSSEQVRKNNLKKRSKPQPPRQDRQLTDERRPAPAAPAAKKAKTQKEPKKQKPSAAAPAAAAAVDANYGSQEYWEARHAESTDFDSKFEWFLGYADLRPILQGDSSTMVDYAADKALFVDLGCGTSRFLMELKQDGYAGPCLGLDYSAEAIERMLDCGEHEVEYRVADGTTFADADGGAALQKRKAKYVLDKSLMDTMLHHEGSMMGGQAAVERMLGQVSKCLADDGTLFVVTQLDPNQQKDAKFLTEVVIPALTCDSDDGKFLSSVVAHVTNSADEDEEEEDAPLLPVPTVFVFRFLPVTQRAEDFELEMEIVEYEAGGGDDDDDDEDEEDEEDSE